MKLTSVSATVNGKVNPNGASTTVTFEYGTSSSYGSSVTAAQSPVPGPDWVIVTAEMTGLTPGTAYYYRIKAVNSGGTSYGDEMVFNTPAAVSDVEGNLYNTVIIGTQTWMQENLKTRKYNDNTNIPNVTDAAAWAALSTPGYCWYNNDKSTYGDVYGALYNWYAVNTGKLCPTGWHVPTDEVWTTLITFLGGESIAGGKMKELGTTHWISPNTEATNESYFSALPGGVQPNYGGFIGVGEAGYWWTSTSSSFSSAFSHVILNNSGSIGRNASLNQGGFSVRCIKD